MAQTDVRHLLSHLNKGEWCVATHIQTAFLCHLRQHAIEVYVSGMIGIVAFLQFAFYDATVAVRHTLHISSHEGGHTDLSACSPSAFLQCGLLAWRNGVVLYVSHKIAYAHIFLGFLCSINVAVCSRNVVKYIL